MSKRLLMNGAPASTIAQVENSLPVQGKQTTSTIRTPADAEQQIPRVLGGEVVLSLPSFSEYDFINHARLTTSVARYLNSDAEIEDKLEYLTKLFEALETIGECLQVSEEK